VAGAGLQEGTSGRSVRMHVCMGTFENSWWERDLNNSY
jgi:hypothetical protein